MLSPVLGDWINAPSQGRACHAVFRPSRGSGSGPRRRGSPPAVAVAAGDGRRASVEQISIGRAPPGGSRGGPSLRLIVPRVVPEGRRMGTRAERGQGWRMRDLRQQGRRPPPAVRTPRSCATRGDRLGGRGRRLCRPRGEWNDPRDAPPYALSTFRGLGMNLLPRTSYRRAYQWLPNGPLAAFLVGHRWPTWPT